VSDGDFEDVFTHIEHGDIGKQTQEQYPASDSEGDLYFNEGAMNFLEHTEKNLSAVQGQNRKHIKYSEVDIEHYRQVQYVEEMAGDHLPTCSYYSDYSGELIGTG